MKIFNEENGVKKVYVQLNDIAMLMHSDTLILASVMKRFFYDVFIVTDENRFEFCEFTDPEELEYFEGMDWIVDYKKYRNLTEEQLIAAGQAIAEEMNQIAQTYNSYTPEEREQHQDMLARHEHLDYKMKSLAEVLWLKKGIRIMPFPVVPDSDGATLVADDDHFAYVAHQGLNPLQMIISRKDGKKMDVSTTSIPMGFLQSADMIVVNQNLENNEFFGDFELKRELSEDGKALLTTYRIITKEEKEDHSLAATKAKEEEKENRKLSKRIFNGLAKFFQDRKSK